MWGIYLFKYKINTWGLCADKISNIKKTFFKGARHQFYKTNWVYSVDENCSLLSSAAPKELYQVWKNNPGDVMVMSSGLSLLRLWNYIFVTESENGYFKKGALRGKESLKCSQVAWWEMFLELDPHWRINSGYLNLYCCDFDQIIGVPHLLLQGILHYHYHMIIFIWSAGFWRRASLEALRGCPCCCWSHTRALIRPKGCCLGAPPINQ